MEYRELSIGKSGVGVTREDIIYDYEGMVV
jgi:hypothetical protein